MRNTIKFTTADWVEVVEALGSKIRQIQAGQLGPEDHPGQDREWLSHLRRIIRKIEGRNCNASRYAVFEKPVITTKEEQK